MHFTAWKQTQRHKKVFHEGLVISVHTPTPKAINIVFIIAYLNPINKRP